MRNKAIGIILGTVVFVCLLSLTAFLQLNAYRVSDNPRLLLIETEESVFPDGAWGLNWLPDETISFRRTTDAVHVWLAAEKSTYCLIGSDFDNLAPHKVDEAGQAEPVLAPSGSGFDRDYAGAGAVFQAFSSEDLLMIYHAEDQTTCGPDKALVSIGVAQSSDGGVSWSRNGQIVTGRDATLDCIKFNGAGNPSVVKSPDGTYLYLYYVDWDSNMSLGPDEVHLARSPVSANGAVGSWQKYYNGQFSEPGLGGNSTPVIRRSSESAGFTGLPNISYNKDLDQYLAILTGHDGFSIAVSDNGISWSLPTLFFPFPVPTDAIGEGDEWYSYPTFLSPNEETHMTTSFDGHLYYAKGGWLGNPPHHLMRRAGTIRFLQHLPAVRNPSNFPTPSLAPTQTPSATAIVTITPTSTPTVTPTSVPIPPAAIDIPPMGEFVPSPAWAWVCSGDFSVRLPDGSEVVLHDQDESTGLVVGLYPDSEIILLAPWGGSCTAMTLGSMNEYVTQLISDLLTIGCGQGCANVHVVELASDGEIVADYWIP